MRPPAAVVPELTNIESTPIEATSPVVPELANKTQLNPSGRATALDHAGGPGQVRFVHHRSPPHNAFCGSGGDRLDNRIRRSRAKRVRR